MEWEEFNPKLKCIAVWKERCQVMKDVSTTPAGGEYPFSGLSVVQVMAVSAHLSFPPLISKVQKVTKERVHQVHTWDDSYSTGIANATKSY